MPRFLDALLWLFYEPAVAFLVHAEISDHDRHRWLLSEDDYNPDVCPDHQNLEHTRCHLFRDYFAGLAAAGLAAAFSFLTAGSALFAGVAGFLAVTVTSTGLAVSTLAGSAAKAVTANSDATISSSLFMLISLSVMNYVSTVLTILLTHELGN